MTTMYNDTPTLGYQPTFKHSPVQLVSSKLSASSGFRTMAEFNDHCCVGKTEKIGWTLNPKQTVNERTVVKSILKDASKRGDAKNKVLKKALETVNISSPLAEWRKDTPSSVVAVKKHRRDEEKLAQARAAADKVAASLLKEEEKITKNKKTKKQRKAARRLEEKEKELLEKERQEMEKERQEKDRREKERLEREEAIAVRDKRRNEAKVREHQYKVKKDAENSWVAVPRGRPTRTKERKRYYMCPSVRKGERCRWGQECNKVHNIYELTIERCFHRRCERIMRLEDGTYINPDREKICRYIHDGERQDAYLNRLGMSALIPRSGLGETRQEFRGGETVLRVPRDMAQQAMDMAMRNGDRNIKIEIVR